MILTTSRLGIFILLFGFFAAAKAANVFTADELGKKAGKISSKTELIWNRTGSTSFRLFENKYYSLLHHNCIQIKADGGEEDDPKLSTAIVLERTKACLSYIKDSDVNFLGIEDYSFQGWASLNEVYQTDVPLFEQKIKINGIDAVYFGGLLNSTIGSEKKVEPQYRFQIFLFCDKKPFRIGAVLPAGKPSIEFVNSKTFEWPEDFKSIISSFKCKDLKK
ncbi:hypothetical protein [Bdellovibrio sp. HCB2-146]|uniref:hypothetical protein n=1 Tax=Bdellovibrio sp. HCB2-146 TaxID=3394362 RepID=UPI0039BC7E0A